jgi:hypothetical protein
MCCAATFTPPQVCVLASVRDPQEFLFRKAAHWDVAHNMSNDLEGFRLHCVIYVLEALQHNLPDLTKVDVRTYK